MSQIILLGFGGQALFASRVLLQWIASERAERSVVPYMYWRISVAGSSCVLLYALLAGNGVYVLSVLPGLFVSVRNLALKGPSLPTRLLPYAALLLALVVGTAFSRPYFGPPLLALVGLLGSVLWSARHIVQWWISERRGASELPPVFWTLSLGGSLLLIAYAVAVRDPVMVAGYGLGVIPYARNLVLGRRSQKRCLPQLGLRRPDRPVPEPAHVLDGASDLLDPQPEDGSRNEFDA